MNVILVVWIDKQMKVAGSALYLDKWPVMSLKLSKSRKNPLCLRVGGLRFVYTEKVLCHIVLPLNPKLLPTYVVAKFPLPSIYLDLSR